MAPLDGSAGAWQGAWLAGAHRAAFTPVTTRPGSAKLP